MTLTYENYHGPEAQAAYMSNSQLTDFINCEFRAVANVESAIYRELTTALLVGSYVDAYFSGMLEAMKVNAPDLYGAMLTKAGTLRAEINHAQTVIARVERDPRMMQYLSGEKQRIMTGEIEGVPFRAMMDSYHEGKCIVDLKVIRDMDDQDWIEKWGYPRQGAIYQEIVRQNTGERLPFVLAVATKEKAPDIALIRISDARLQAALKEVREVLPRVQNVKEGRVAPSRCERCPACRATKILSGVTMYG